MESLIEVKEKQRLIIALVNHSLHTESGAFDQVCRYNKISDLFQNKLEKLT